MKDAQNSKICLELCLPNCDETTYQFGVDTTELNTEELCMDPDTRKVIIAKGKCVL
jgi:hypothetical protein